MRDIPEIPGDVSFPKEEEKVHAYWESIDAFKTSVKLSEGKPRYTFYDGPPFATGLPHYGHFIASTIKDVVTRYAHSTGHYVERRFGWDCHGLPVEHEIDKVLGITGPDDVKKIGIAAYNEECRSIVMRYSKEWEKSISRLGRWIDFENDYKTMNLSFMESVWWVFKQLYEKNQVYRGYRIMPYSTGCCTPLSNFEAGENYKEVNDPSVVVSFPLVSDPKVSLLAWTTTPWTLPSNLALCVNPDYEYVKILDEESGNTYILLQKRLDILYKDPKKAKFKILQKYKGTELKGLEYEPLFNYFASRKANGAFVVLTDGYVTDADGTGIVHQAPGFGEDDFRVCMANNIVTGEGDMVCPVDATGKYTSEVTDYVGIYVKEADKQIQKDLKARGRLVRQTQFSHQYPFCWRSDTPLIYKAVPAWFVRVSNINEKLLANNQQTYWVPEFVKEGRFANWLGGARDWNISRNRYWGTPIPLWVSDDFEEIVAVGSVEELKTLSGIKTDITDIHRHHIDGITIPSQKGKGVLRRIDEVFDCWFESGSMPYAQQHYPFENKADFEKMFPAQFIAEGLDQTRGWFYTLMVLSTHLFDKPPFMNVIVNGLVLASDGKKMSKRLKNYPDPTLVMNSIGADPLRLYLMTSPAVRAEPLRFKEEGVRDLVAKVFLPWYNSYRFFFADLGILRKEFNVEFEFDPKQTIKTDNIMDKWILASTQSLIQFVRTEMAAYRLYTVSPRLVKLVEELTNWYIRFNRRRLKGEYGLEDAMQANQTLFEVLFTLTHVMSPFVPFICESMYQNLKTCLPKSFLESQDARSVHFLSFPDAKKQYFDADIERAVARLQSVIDLGRLARDKRTIPLKTPLRSVVVIHPDPQYAKDIKLLETYILEELNIREITVTSDEEKYGVYYTVDPDYKVLGQKLRGNLAKVKKALPNISPEEVKQYVETKKLVVEGVLLEGDDLKVVRHLRSSDTFEAQSDKDVLVLLDVALDETLISEGLAREVVNRVQRLRKKAGLQVIDEVHYYFEITVDPKSELAGVLVSQKDFLNRLLKQDLVPLAQKSAAANVIISEEQEVNESKFNLCLVKP
ncbi:isoleucine--tRNA ligase [Nowakowskiella sp. JEL0407]|nr:isoleucine--tRNA ligase [Nowakowskiella sp. JEL0407]